VNGSGGGARAEFERLVQANVDPALWQQAKQQASILYEWHSAQQSAGKKRLGGGGGYTSKTTVSILPIMVVSRVTSIVDCLMWRWWLSAGRAGGEVAKEFGQDLGFNDASTTEWETSDEDEEYEEEEELVETIAAMGLGNGGSEACYGVDELDDKPSPLPTISSSGPVNGRALYYQCEEHISRSGLSFSPEDLGSTILDVLTKSRNDEAELQMTLFDLLGETVSLSYPQRGLFFPQKGMC